jgi:hypothetical protein
MQEANTQEYSKTDLGHNRWKMSKCPMNLQGNIPANWCNIIVKMFVVMNIPRIQKARQNFWHPEAKRFPGFVALNGFISRKANDGPV